ncbi:hypothetical protein [Streptomyces rubiginosohelvolus]|uniref:hypothetical protein n=1 Tax=Streptomyces rubiginosohelvolus TaxID=67362 RepID=UPI00371BD9EB
MATLRVAKAELARQMTVAAETVNVEPAFARDNTGALIVAIDRPWGIDEYRITDAGYKRISTYARDRTPAEVLAASLGQTPVPPRP